MREITNHNSKYIYGDRYQRFINKLCNFAITARSTKEIDKSPIGTLSGNFGDVLTKDLNHIYYNSPDTGEFISLSDQFPDITRRTEVVLSSGINKKVSWVKTDDSEFSWKFVGYYTYIADRNCCIGSKPKKKTDTVDVTYPYVCPECPKDTSVCCHDYYIRVTADYGNNNLIQHTSGMNGIVHIIISKENQTYSLTNANNAVLGDTVTVFAELAAGIHGIYGCKMLLSNNNTIDIGIDTTVTLICTGNESYKVWTVKRSADSVNYIPS